ncbi:DUF3290 family protein [Lactobacillaceae bacterium L1_55_11]|nr:DUF3290 family protein [Lactobacillaceae bacterium L1_55_11]
MTFYSADYLSKQSNLTNTVGFILLGITFILLAVGVFASFTHRLNIRYRDLTIITLLLFLLLASVQYTDYQQAQAKSSQQSQMGAFAKQVAKDQNVKTSKIYFNTTAFTDGLLVKIGNKYYSMNLSKDKQSYSLQRVYLLNDNVEVVQ